MGLLYFYRYYKKGSVNATTAGAQTNYQLELVVGESGGAGGAGVHCGANCADFPNDIRFTKEDGETKHDYWIEKIEGTTPNRKATVIIEVASIPASGSVDFYMYYGNWKDSSESSVLNTFIREIDSGQPVRGAWTLDGNALDTSGNGNNGTLNGGMGYTTGKFGQAGLFDGLDDSINCGTDVSLNITDAITIEAWVKTSTIATQRIVSKQTTYGFTLAIEGTGRSQLYIKTQNGAVYPTDDIVSADGNWHYIVGVREPLALSKTAIMVDQPNIKAGHSVGWNPDGDRIAVCGVIPNRITVYSYNKLSETIIEVVSVQDSENMAEACDCAFNPDGDRLAVVAKNSDALLVFDFDKALGTLTEVTHIVDATYMDSVRAVVWNPDGDRIATASYTTDSIAVYNFNKGAGTLTYDIGLIDHTDLSGSYELDFNPDGDRIAAVGRTSHSVVVYNYNKGASTLTEVAKLVGTANTDLNAPLDVVFNPDGDRIAAVGYTNDALVVFDFNKSAGTLTKEISLTSQSNIDGPHCIDWNPIDNRISVSGYNADSCVVYFYKKSGSALSELYGVVGDSEINEARGVGWNPDGDRIAVSAYNDGGNGAIGIFSSSKIKIYVDGVLKDTKDDLGGSTDTGSNNLLIGDDARPAVSAFFNGSIDEVKIYNRSLISDEISDLYGTGGDRYGYITTNYPGRVLVRKYVSPEPTWGEWGEEQSIRAQERGFYYAKLGSINLYGLEHPSFRITEELNKIPSFEFEIANCSDNRTAIAAGITDVFRIYRRIGITDTLMFTGIINSDSIEYLSLERIRITGYASYIDLNWRFHQHLNSEDAENVDKVYIYTGSYSDKTTEANNDTINDVPMTYSSVNDALYIGQGEQFFGMQIKYSTKGVQAASTTVVWEYSKGSSVWATLDILDETRTFTEAVGTHYITISHKPSDWAKDTVNSVKKFWIRARLSGGSYTTQPKLDRIKMTNTDVYRVYYFDTVADMIMDEVLAGTGYSMDVTDACPSDTISIVAEYETKLRIVAGIANALTWDDSGDKKGYQWWIDTNKKVHFKQKRGATLGDITGELTILNNIEDYFNLSNRLHFFGNYDGLNQLRAVIEDIDSQDTHEIRELAVPEERYNNYIPLKEAAQKAMTYTKAPLQKIAATVTTKYWLDNSFEVGDTVTLHATSWDVASQAFQIVRADIGARVTNLDIGLSQEHLDALKAGLQRQLDISGIRMHGSTTLLQFGPETMNYQRVDGSTVYPAHLKFEIPSDARYIHKVLVSWKLGPYRAEVTGGAESEGHDHDGYAGAGGDFTPEVADGGAHTPTELSKAHKHLTETSIQIAVTTVEFQALANNNVNGANHRHAKGQTGPPDNVANVMTGLTYGSWCDVGECVQGTTHKNVADDDHKHFNTGKYTGYSSPTLTVNGWNADLISSIHAYAFSETSNDESPAHAHTINYVADHPHTGVYHGTHSDHVIQTAAASNVDLELGIIEVPGGTVMQLTVNGEDVTTVNGNGTDIVITGYCHTGSNTVELYPIVGSNTKGGATLEGRGILFIEAAKF